MIFMEVEDANDPWWRLIFFEDKIVPFPNGENTPMDPECVTFHNVQKGTRDCATMRWMMPWTCTHLRCFFVWWRDFPFKRIIWTRCCEKKDPISKEMFYWLRGCTKIPLFRVFKAVCFIGIHSQKSLKLIAMCEGGMVIRSSVLPF